MLRPAAVIATGLVLALAAPEAVAGPQPAPQRDGAPATATAAKKKKPKRKCRKGYVRKTVKVKSKRKTKRRSRCVKKATRKRPAHKAPGGTGTPSAPPASSGPAPVQPAPAPAPGAPQQDPKQRATELLRGKVFTYYKGSTDYSSSTSKQMTLCRDNTFRYHYEFQGSATSSFADAAGTWVVDDAQFDDANQRGAALVTLHSDNQSALPDGQHRIDAVGDKVYIDGEEWGYGTASC